MRTSACLTTCEPAHPLGAEQQVGGDGPLRRDLGDQERLEVVEAGELLVDAAVGVVAVDERVGERPASAGARAASPPASPTARAARRRFQRAITLVKALSSTGSWYSSGPMTP